MTKVIILINRYHAFIEYNIRILGRLFNLVLVSVNIIINNWAKIVLDIHLILFAILISHSVKTNNLHFELPGIFEISS